MTRSRPSLLRALTTAGLATAVLVPVVAVTTVVNGAVLHAAASSTPSSAAPAAVLPSDADQRAEQAHARQVQAAARAAAARAAEQAAAEQAAAKAAAIAAREAEVRAAQERADRSRRESADPRAIARALLAERGLADQFGCLDRLWTKESEWRVAADNPTSSAYGIPQALPGSKMATAGSDWRTNPRTQIRWGLGYIADSYGSPCSAWRHSQANNWY